MLLKTNTLFFILHGIANLLCSFTANADVPRPRGVSLAKAALYQPRADKTWLCLDGSRTIPYTQVNDDYCDCADGSDEPGTSACINGQFNCLNIGFKSVDLPSSRVDDTICDCCDGSDEQGTVTCPNTCDELGQADRIKRQNEAELQKRGVALRNEMIARGKQLRDERSARRAELEVQLKEKEALKAEKDELKRNAEAIEAEAIEVFKKEHPQELQTTRQDAEPQQLRKEATASFVQYDINKDGFVEISEIINDLALDRDRNGVVTVEEAKYFLDERDKVNLDEFIMLAWPNIKPIKMLAEGIFEPSNTETKAQTDNEASDDEIIKETDEAQQAEQAQTEVNEEGAADVEHEDDEAEEDQYEDDEEPDVGVGEATPETQTPQDYDPETQRLIELANEARNAYAEAERYVREIQHEIKELDNLSGKDYGPVDEYAAMDGECYNFEDREYIYTLCMFDRAVQKQRSGGGETNLGRWDQWDNEGDSKYKEQKYINGAACWNGPQRTAVINISCGLENRITSVTEPNRCEYSFDFETPAACEGNDAESDVHDEL